MFGGILGGLAVATGLNFAKDWFNRRAERRTFADNANMSWQMWHAQNAYNDPAAQMARFQKAGLNPNLIYGQTNTAAPISVPASHGTPPGFEPMLDAQLDNLRANTERTRAETNKVNQDKFLSLLNTESNLEFQRAGIEGQRWKNKFDSALYDYAGKQGLPPQLVQSQEYGSPFSQVTREVRHNGLGKTVNKYGRDFFDYLQEKGRDLGDWVYEHGPRQVVDFLYR